MLEALTLVAAVVVGTLSAGRITRLITQDKFPPAVWLRIKWDDRFDSTETRPQHPWWPLLHCHWCMAPWVSAPILAWAWLSDLHTSWWVFNLWLAVSYVASMIVERDEA